MTHQQLYTHAYTHTYIHTHIHTNQDVKADTAMTHPQLYIHAYTHTYIHTYIHTNQDVKAETAMTHPQLYIPGQRKENFNFGKLAIWMANGLVHCALAFALPTAAFAYLGVDDLGVFGT